MKTMQQFVETIKIEDGKALNLNFHQARMERTMRHFFAHTPVPMLSGVLSPHARYALLQGKGGVWRTGR